MSWLARSIANSLRLDEDDAEEEEPEQPQNPNNGDPKSPSKLESDPNSGPSTPTARGVKEDLSELTQTLSRQFWGVASFLAPPSEPKPDPSSSEPQISDPDGTDEDIIAGIRSDFAEISGRFRSGISKLSGNQTVSEITKMASSFLQLGSEEERLLSEYDLNGVVGVTEEVVAFARSVAMHPETWLNFPLPDDPDSDSDDFDLSDAQQEHALAVERLAPRLAALRLELCPGYMSDEYFWKIYFVLLHLKLNKNDADILSTTQVLEARSMLTQVLDKRKMEKEELNFSASSNVQAEEAEHHLSVPVSVQQESLPLQTSVAELTPPVGASGVKTDNQPVQSTEAQITDKSVVKEVPVNPAAQQPSSGSADRFSYEIDEDDADDWLKDETSEMVGGTEPSVPTANEDDVSFSDLEEEDGDVPLSYKKAASGSDSSTAKDSRDWVQLNRNSGHNDKDKSSTESRQAGSEHSSGRSSVNKDSNDWLDVADIDVL